jgi:LacI family transcriptional regulator
MLRHGLEAEVDVVPSTYSEAGGYAAAQELLARAVRPTAVFAGADVAAIGVLNAVFAAGLRIPEDLSVAGYDNTTVAAMGPISLTSVDQDGRLMGANAARLLLERSPGNAARRRTTGARVAPWRSGV